MGGGQILLNLSQILQANSKLFALGLELCNAAVPLTPQSVNRMDLALNLLVGRLKLGLRGSQVVGESENLLLEPDLTVGRQL